MHLSYFGRRCPRLSRFQPSGGHKKPVYDSSKRTGDASWYEFVRLCPNHISVPVLKSTKPTSGDCVETMETWIYDGTIVMMEQSL